MPPATSAASNNEEAEKTDRGHTHTRSIGPKTSGQRTVQRPVVAVHVPDVVSVQITSALSIVHPDHRDRSRARLESCSPGG
jgi:hypothetical protein